MTIRRVAALAAVPLLIASLAGCTSSTPSGGGTSGSGPDGDGSDAPRTVTAREWQSELASCMRAAGHDYQDPGQDGSMGVSAGDGDTQKMVADLERCQAATTDKLGERPAMDGGKASGAEFDKQRDCLRKAGVKADEGTAIDLSSIPEGTLRKCGIAVPGAAGGGR